MLKRLKFLRGISRMSPTVGSEHARHNAVEISVVKRGKENRMFFSIRLPRKFEVLPAVGILLK
jgi:hypothetical protein